MVDLSGQIWMQRRIWMDLVSGGSAFIQDLGVYRCLDPHQIASIKPYLPGNRVSARDAARRLAERFQQNHSHLQLHLVADSAFGSFKEDNFYLDKGVMVTMSMSYKEKPWLWDLLAHRSPLDCGRSALVPADESNSAIFANTFHTKSDSDKIMIY